MYKRILLPLDGSALAEQALPHAFAQAKQFQAELILLKILEPLAKNVNISIDASTANLTRKSYLAPRRNR